MKNQHQKFDYEALKNTEIKNKYIVKEMNKPNLDRMAHAFYKLLRK